MDRKLIDADRFEEELYHEAFERDSDMQRWDSGCWIRYKLFERMLEKQPAVDAIPIEWIEKQRKWMAKGSDREQNIGWLLEEWKKENDTKTD